jgi:NAD(P)H-dependent FMN reductase
VSLGAGAPRILLIAGSARAAALSVRLREASRREVQAVGAEASVLDLRSLALPVYDGDLEVRDGVPAGALTLRDAFGRADGLLFVTPEYNAFPTPLSLNAFDWLSRVQASGDSPAGMAVVANKPVALVSTSPGAFGGMRALALMRQYLSGAFQMLELPQQLAVGKANEAVDGNGTVKDPRAQQTLADVVGRSKAQQTCNVCHGASGISSMPDTPHLAGQPEIYLVHQLQAYRNGARRHEVMNVVAKPLTDDEITALARWYSSIKLQADAPN